jgi:putative flippase GtrA
MSNLLGLQLSKFIVVGVLNTLVDIIFFNIFRRFKRFSPVVASYMSSTIAMIQSYFLNRYFTFSGFGTGTGFEAIKFFVATFISIYIIHNGIVWIFTTKLLGPGKLIAKIAKKLPLINKFSDSFIRDNSAKLFAIFTSLVWNFLFYKFWVFVS